MFEQAHFQTPLFHFPQALPDHPVMYFAPSLLRAQAERFLRGFDGEVTYAIKANARPEVLGTLAAAGIVAFDVASPEEMDNVRAVSSEAGLHYNNPVRSAGEVAYGKAQGVRSWSVDALSELEKLGPPAFEEEEVAVRLKLPVKGAQYDFGEKFGATPEQAVALLRAVAALGYQPALCFHVGTQCDVPEVWEAYVDEAARVARAAGVRLARLNVGGGFAAHRSGAAPDLEAIFSAVARAAQRVFEHVPQLVCEPGRAMVAESFALLTRVKARRDGAIYLNDGIYGGFAEARDICANTRVVCFAPNGMERRGTSAAVRVFGPTCDSLDCLPEPLIMPEALAEDDYVYMRGMGAYSLAIATGFNGYGLRDVVTVGAL